MNTTASAAGHGAPRSIEEDRALRATCPVARTEDGRWYVSTAALVQTTSGLELLRSFDFRVAAFGLRDDAIPLDDYAATAPERLALVFGTEGDGLLPSTMEAADDVVMIPMSGDVDSLNVASATGIAIWATPGCGTERPILGLRPHRRILPRRSPARWCSPISLDGWMNLAASTVSFTNSRCGAGTAPIGDNCTRPRCLPLVLPPPLGLIITRTRS